MRNLPPPDLLMQISNSSSVTDFQNSFPHVRHEVEKYLARAGLAFDKFQSILDFGCGLGRFSYAMAPLLKEGQELYGCDVDTRCATWSAKNAGYKEVVNNSLQPPLPWGNEKFDFIYALSVFTHLTFEHQMRWTWELMRVLRPGGVMLLTTHGLGHLGPALVNGSKWSKREYMLIDERCVFAALAESGGDSIEGQREVASFHNNEAVAMQFHPLSLRFHEHVSGMAGGQSMNILAKPEGASVMLVPAELAASGKDGSLINAASLAPPARLELRGFLAMAAPHYNLSALEVSVEAQTTQGEKHRATAKLTTPVSLGSHHQLSFQVELPHLAAGSTVRVRLENSHGELVPSNLSTPHWLVS